MTIVSFPHSSLNWLAGAIAFPFFFNSLRLCGLWFFLGVSHPCPIANNTRISDLRVAVCDMSPETEMILGMDAIMQMDFAITNGNNQTQFSFIIPPRKEKIDFTK
jgi:hypothetical protein